MWPQLHFWAKELGWVALMTGLALLVLTVLSMSLHGLYFVMLPRWAILRFQGTHPDRLRRYLEWVVATPSLVGPASKLVARGGLVGLYTLQGRHAEAEAHCRANLESLEGAWHLVDVPSLEADTRRRLADCLEALGRADEAEEERRRAEDCIDRAPGDPLRFITQGTLLERQNRHAEACEAFERALAATPELNRPGRIECLVHLTLACHNAGRPVESLRSAEEAIAMGAEGTYLRVAHRMAGVACGNLGRLEESEEHQCRAYEVAAAQGDKGEMGHILGSLADIKRKRGKLSEADEACQQAAGLDPKGARMAFAVRSSILREWGRYDEALEMLRRHDETAKLVIPAYERRLRAACDLDRSRIEAESGRGDDAWAHIQEAIAVLGNDAKLGLKCEAAVSWILAVRGLADESREAADRAEARLVDFAEDPSTGRGVLYDLGMAASTRGDHEEAEDCWTRYLGLSPDPVHRPTALYYRGESRRQRGDRAGALADLREAVAMEIDSHHARLARRRLSESLLW